MRSRDRRIVLALGCLALAAFYWTERHAGCYGDGLLFVQMWRHDVFVQPHFLLLPLARLVSLIAAPFADLDARAAIQAVSAGSAALLVALTWSVARRRCGTPAATIAALFLAFTPSLRFFAGAVEVPALAGCMALLAFVAADCDVQSRRGARLLLLAGFGAAAATHASLVLLLPALLIVHAERERRGGRALSMTSFLAAGALLALVAGLVAMLVVLLDHWLVPARFSGYSAVETYLRSMSLWQEGARPPLDWIVAGELLAPVGPLLPLALAGAWASRRERGRLAALILWILPFAACALHIGAREVGAYLLPALPALALLAAAGSAHLLARGGAAAATLVVLSAASLAAGLALFAASTPDGAWLVSPETLALPFDPLDLGVLAAVPPGAAWTAALLLALAAGGSSGGAARGRIVACLALALLFGAELGGGERFRRAWPQLWNQRLIDYCDALRARTGAQDLLVTFCPSINVRWAIEQYYERPLVDLSEVDSFGEEGAAAWVETQEQRMLETRARGGRVWLADDGLAALFLLRAVRPRAWALALSWLAEERVARLAPLWPASQGALEAAAPLLPAPR